MASPSSSPRLPSPPPMAEDQLGLGPKSPIAVTEDEHNPFEANASRRIRPGTKAADMALGPPLVPLTEIDSPFQLAEHLKSLHNAALHRDGSSTVSPIDRTTALRLAQPPDGVDKYLWLYELCRLLCKETNAMIVALFQDDPPCSAQTCTEMRASEWQYLCAVHDPPKPCCAIDYCCHTLDWTNNVLTSQKNFPSRLSVGGDGGAGTSQLRQLTNIFRRVYRIFAHAWFQHRDMYWKVELKSGLYVFFKTVCDCYTLIPEDNYTVPPEAEGLEPADPPEQKKPSVLKRDEKEKTTDEAEKSDSRPPSGTSHPTQRHRHTPSVGSESITTVLEETEEDDENTSEVEDTVILNATDTPTTAGEAATEIKSGEVEDDASNDTIGSDIEDVTSSDDSTSEVPQVSVEPANEEAAAAAVNDPANADGGEKTESAAASVTSDTDSHGSWQVLTDENQSTESSETTSSSTDAEAGSTSERTEASEVGEESDSPTLTRSEHDHEPLHPGPLTTERSSESTTTADVLAKAGPVLAEGKSKTLKPTMTTSSTPKEDQVSATSKGSNESDEGGKGAEEIAAAKVPVAE